MWNDIWNVWNDFWNMWNNCNARDLRCERRQESQEVPAGSSSSLHVNVKRFHNLLPAWQYRNRVFMKWVPSGVIQTILTNQHEIIPILAGGSFFGNIFVSLNQIW